MKNRPLVTVCVPVYNTEKYLRACVDSITLQTYDNLDILLVDDGSTDGSSSICEGYANADRRVRVFHQKHGGVSSARNNGIKHAKGEYLVFVDSDDKISSNYIEKLLEANGSDEQSGVLNGASISFMNKKQVDTLISESAGRITFSVDDYIRAIIESRVHGSICRFLFKTAGATVLFNEKIHYMEDVDYLVRYAAKRDLSKVVIFPTPEYTYNNNNASASNNGGVEAYESICLSLDCINDATNRAYESEISDCKIRMLRWQMNKCRNWKDRKKLIRYYRGKIGQYHYSGKSRNDKIFVAAMRLKSSLLIRAYYCIYDMTNRGK